MRKSVCLLLLLLLALPLAGQIEKLPVETNKSLGKVSDPPPEMIDRGETFKGFRLSPYYGAPYQAEPDSAALFFYRHALVEAEGLAVGYTANRVSPRLHKTFFDREARLTLFPYRMPYKGMVYTPDKLWYYDTKSPYTNLFYQRNGPAAQREEEVDMTLALNLGKAINVGGDFNYTLSRGQYIASMAQNVQWRIFGSYKRDRYELFASVGRNAMKMGENGGISDDNYITNPGQFGGGRSNLTAIQIPVKIAGGVGNTVSLTFVDLFHRYNLGSYRHYRAGDLLPDGKRYTRDSTLFVPWGSISHRLHYASDWRLFKSAKDLAPILEGNKYEYYWDRSKQGLAYTVMYHPQDSIRLGNLQNTVALSLREGFRPWVKFGLTGYVRTEVRNSFMRDSIPDNNKRGEFATFLGANIARKGGEGLNFEINAETALIGPEIGSFFLDGEVKTRFRLWSIPLGLEAEGHFYNQRPSYLWRHHHGSFFRWDKELTFIQNLTLGGSLVAPQWGTRLSLRSATLGNWLYFDAKAQPQQATGAIQIIEARVHEAYAWRWFGLEAAASYQISSHPEVLPLPALSAYLNLYFHGYVAKVMRSQVGVEAYYHTRYYAPYWQPAIQQFILQREQLVGNFPLVNIYANFRLRRVRFFLLYYNAVELVATSSLGRFSLAHYPINPNGLRIGLAFDFNN